MHPIMNPGINKFIMRTLVAALPLLLLVGIYVVRDPFHVVHPVASTEHGDSVVAGNNAGVIAVQTYLAHNCERRYDSFIFGSSMSQNSTRMRRYFTSTRRASRSTASSTR